MKKLIALTTACFFYLVNESSALAAVTGGGGGTGGTSGTGEQNMGQFFGFGGIPSAGAFISSLFDAILAIMVVVLLFFILFAGFKYLTSGGNKETLAQARDMIVHSIIGLALFFVLFLVFKFILEIFGIQTSII